MTVHVTNSNPTPKPGLWTRLRALVTKAKPELRHVAAGVGAAAVAAFPLLLQAHGHLAALTTDDWETIGGAFITGTGLAAWIPSISQRNGSTD